jgi:hypothetical protein
MIPIKELEAMQLAINGLLPDVCNILSLTKTPNGRGGVTESWGTASENVSCRLDFISGSESTVAMSNQPFTRWIMTLPYSTGVVPTNRIVHNSLTYNVIAINADTSWIASKRVLLEAIR